MKDCIFCKITNGKIPSNKVYEDENFFAFLDITPKSEGHTLVIPKKHFENIFDADEEILSLYGGVFKKISDKLKEDYNYDGVNIVNNSGKASGQEVMHLHFHVIPRYSQDKLKLEFIKK